MAIDWQGLKDDYETTGAGPGVLARRFKCSPETIRRRARKEGWKRKTAEAVRDKWPQKEGAADSPPVKVEEISDDHRSLWMGVKKRLVSGLNKDDLKAGLEELKVAKVAGEVLASVIKGERQAWGLDEGECEGAPDGAEEIISEIESLTVSSGADEALDGE
ncbi:MAG: hypothetical protein HY887_08400 [Deltaproteobacteria bacterium]|nr:hypothetical protein [Deltaproteobacteria bacterium]